jgi:hypothetical protein
MPNQIAGLEAFIEAWDAGRSSAESAAASPTQPVGPDGQINVEGSATCSSAFIFVPSDPRFVEALEPGVRALCIGLVETLGCVTYSSCQGHRAVEPGGAYRRRHVGIVPRNELEATRLQSALEDLCRETNSSVPEAEVRVLLVVSKVTGDRGERPCLDLEFYGRDVSEERYFQEVDRLTGAFVTKLADLSR